MELQKVEYFDDRYYKIAINGKPEYYPSVTTILNIVAKPFLVKWYGDLGTREAEYRKWEASERGTRIHWAWYVMSTGGVVIFNDYRYPQYGDKEIERFREESNNNLAIIRKQDEMVDVWKLQKLCKILKPKFIASEVTVYDEEEKEAGTIDSVIQIEGGTYPVDGRNGLTLPGGTYVVDLKTGKSFDSSAYLQMAAYARMYQKLYGAKISGTIAIHTQGQNRLGIEGLKLLPRIDKEVDQDYHIFRRIADVWKYKNKTINPKTFDFPSIIKLEKEMTNARA